MDPTLLAVAAIGAFGSIMTALIGLAGVVFTGNRRAREKLASLDQKIAFAHGLITRMYLVLVAHGWMEDPDLIDAAEDVVRAAERGDT